MSDFEDLHRQAPTEQPLLQQRLRDYLHEARRLMHAQRFEDAERTLCDMLALMPQSYIVLLELLNLCEKQNRIGAARSYAEELAAHYPTALTHRRLGFLLARVNELAAAKTALRNSLALDPGDIATAVTLARMLTPSDEAEAADVLGRVLAIHPNHVATNFQRANLLLRLGRRMEAAVNYRRVVENDPKHLASVTQLMTLLDEQRMRAEAAVIGHSYLELAGPQLRVALKTANLELHLGNKEAAERLFRLVLELDSSNLPAVLNLIKILYDQRREDEARAMHEVAGAIMRAELPKTLCEAIERISTSVAVDYQVHASLASGITIPDRRDWPPEKRFLWGAKASGLLAHWGFFTEHGFSDVAGAFPIPDWRLLETPESGAILVGSHIGPYMPAISCLMYSGLNYKVISVNPSYLLAVPGARTLDPRAGEQHTALAQLSSHVKRGGVVYLAGDGGLGRKYERVYEHKGLKSRFTMSVPTLAYVTRAPIYWYNSLWTNDQAKIELIRGPSVEVGESLEDWSVRWFDFYWTHVQYALDSGPENLNKHQFAKIMSHKSILT